jgi:ribose 5-phosphate isomerase B
MKIALAADHAGFALKNNIRSALEKAGHEVVDFGTNSALSVDYPDYAGKVARAVADGKAGRGILVCSTGVGMSIAANKVKGIRAAVGTLPEEVTLTRKHNDSNVLALGAKFLDTTHAMQLVGIFLATEFEGGRHARRLLKIAELEKSEN